MELGICTRYTRHEATFAAIRLAESVADNGADVSLFTMTSQPSQVSPRWDRELVKLKQMSFTKWAASRQHIIWTAVPHVEQVNWVRQQQKKASILVLWHELAQYDDQSLMAAHQLLCPSKSCYEMLRSWGLKNCVYIPWDCGQPIYTKPGNYRLTHPRLLLPMWDGNPRRSEMTVVDLVQLALQRQPKATITLACNSHSMRAGAMRRFMKVVDASDGRLIVQRNIPPSERFKLFQSHDLTLYPMHFESTGMTAIQSIELGTPVIGFKFRPLDEVLTPVNSILIPCEEETNDMGCPRAIPDYDELDSALYHALHDLEYVRALQQTTTTDVLKRREQFLGTARSALL